MTINILNPEQQAKVQLKAAKDAAFRRRLTANPKAVIEKELGLSLPESLNIEVIEATEKNLVFIIPPKPENFTASMTAEQWLKAHRQELSGPSENPIVQGQARLLAKSWESDGFKQRLLKNPHETIAAEFFVTLPEDLTITVREESIHHAVFVLPPPASADDVTLEELEAFGGVPPLGVVLVASLVGASILGAAGSGLATAASASAAIRQPW